MSLRVCLMLLLALGLSGLAGATVSEPSATAASPLATALAAPAALPSWLAPVPNQSVPRPPDSTLPFLFRSCQSQCYAVVSQCNAGCNGDPNCVQDCRDGFDCCMAWCIGGGCP